MTDRTKRTILVLLIFPVLVAGILVGKSGDSGRRAMDQPEAPTEEVRFGDVFVDPAAGEIRFHGEVRQNEGWVRFLIYLCSYKWMKEEAAIISAAYLTDLQMAIALLDWRLWDALWQREMSGEAVDVFLEWQGKRAEANELIRLPYHLGIGDLILLGSPLFDPLFLARCAQTIVCVVLQQGPQCPLAFLQKSVEEKFTRPCGAAGYHVAGGRLPPPGTRATVIIRVPVPEGVHRDGGGG